MPIALGPIEISTELRDHVSNAINAFANTGPGDPSLVIQTADGLTDLITYTLHATSAFLASVLGKIDVNISSPLVESADNGGAPGRYVLLSSAGTVMGTGVASGPTVVAGLSYLVSNFSLTTPATP